MELLLSWVAFPLLLMALYSGCGLGVEALARTRLPGALLPAVGFAVIVVAGQFLTLVESTAGLTTPLVVVIALAGLGLATIGRRPSRPPVYLVAGLAVVFAVYAAPIVLSGEATLAGYIKLDDTATWLAFTDQVMANGRDLDGLAPSSYEATLQINIGDGYPVGVFIPLGVGSELVAEDPAWLIQPYMATLAVLLALAAWSLVGDVVRSPSIRAALMVVAAQPALLFGYYLWGGVKELAAAALIATTAALAGFALARPAEFGRLVPLAVSTAAVVGVLSGGGAFWLVPILVVALVGFGREIPPRRLAARAGGFALGVGLLALPVIIPGGLLPPTSSPLGDDSALGNLFEPLDPLQVLGDLARRRLPAGHGWRLVVISADRPRARAGGGRRRLGLAAPGPRPPVRDRRRRRGVYGPARLRFTLGGCARRWRRRPRSCCSPRWWARSAWGRLPVRGRASPWPCSWRRG